MFGTYQHWVIQVNMSVHWGMMVKLIMDVCYK